MSLVVYKSSAGSGKTTTLVNEYLSLALRKPERFGNIIALTFTIKATAEMKDRVFVVLHKIIHLDKNQNDAGLHSSIEHIKKATGFTLSEIQSRSRKLLHNILHNYAEFSFSTIDSFVVNIVRSFSQDLNLPFDFNIELDSSLLIEQAIAMLFDKIGSDKQLTDFLIQYMLNNVENERSLKIEDELAKLSKIIFESRHYKYVEKLDRIELATLAKINTGLKRNLAKSEERIKKIAEDTLTLIAQNGIEHSDFFRSSLPKQLVKLKKHIDLPMHDIFDAPENNLFYSTSKPNAVKVRIDTIRPQLEGSINEIAKLIKSYTNLKLILETFNPIALLSEVKRMLNRYSKENNIIHLSESNKLISDVVLQEHIPFIYERVGRKYLHFLVDEFQDTSVIQWNNLIPLIDNSLSTGHFNMIVGDAKQSIYRWRDGDVDQFINLPKINNADASPIMQERAKSIERNYIEKPLQHNYRSDLNIIEFNNEFFDYQLQNKFGNSERISKVYKQHKQIAGKSEENGKVVIQNYPKNGKQTYEEGIKEHINELLEQNYELKDIAIIARSKNILAKASDILIQNNIQVVSNETLYIQNNPQVSLIVSLMSFIGNNNRKNNLLNIHHILNRTAGDNKSDSIKNIEQYLNSIDGKHDIETVCESIQQYGIHLSATKLKELQAYDLAEYLIMKLGLNKKTNPFLQSLLDNILENSQKNGAGLQVFLNFWELKKKDLSISLPEEINAIKLYTIHKAKGLEFPVVVFLANGFDDQAGGTHWVNTKPLEIEGLEIAMIKHKKDLLTSNFKEQFLDEEDKRMMDKLNLIYVANTRPTQQLIILFEEKKGSSWDLFKNFKINNDKFTKVDDNLKIYGGTKHKEKNKQHKTNNELQKIISNPWEKRIRLKQNADIIRSATAQQRIEKGKKMHYLLSLISNNKDIDYIINKVHMEGIISAGELNHYKEKLQWIITHPSTKHFFEHENVEINECAILLPNGKQLRPDKIILKDNEAIIIDYKISDYNKISTFEKEKHLKQVKNYKKLLLDMQFLKVSAHLIYISHSIKVVNT